MLVNWGNLLLDRAKTEEGREAERLVELAEAKYRSALEMNPDQHELIRDNWGNLVSDRARLQNEEDAEAFLAESERTYTASLGAELGRRLIATARQKLEAGRAI